MKLRELLSKLEASVEALTKQQSGLSERVDQLATQMQDNPESATRFQKEMEATRSALNETETKLSAALTDLEALKSKLASSNGADGIPPTVVVPDASNGDGSNREQSQKRKWI